MSSRDIVLAAAGASGPVTYIEDVFSTYLYTGNGSTQTITNGIDLAGKGGMVWTKRRNTTGDNWVNDTTRGITYYIATDLTDAQYGPDANSIASVSTTGYTVGSYSGWNANGSTYVGWTFRKQPKFFDVQTVSHTNGTANTIDLSGLGTVGCVIAKITTTTGDWTVWHRSLTASNNIQLNTTAGQSTTNAWLSVSGTTAMLAAAAPTGTYVIYAYAHNAGGFGLTGTDNVISCGSFTTDGGGNATVDLGYEPQWLLMKKTTGAADQWYTVDTMRGWSQTTWNFLGPNNASAEYGTSTATGVAPNATGFTTNITITAASSTYIYIAIRRGPMKVPTDGTKVFAPSVTTNPNNSTTTNFPVDLSITDARNTEPYAFFLDRLRGGTPLLTSVSTAAENGYAGPTSAKFDSNTSVIAGWSVGASSYAQWNFQRAPGFFDEVCYTGTGSSPNTLSHNLAATPELMIVKCRSSSYNWGVFHSFTGSDTKRQYLNTTAAATTLAYSSSYIPSAPTSSTFSLGTATFLNNAGDTYVAYLFASCPGVSKVTNFTGNGSTQTINCGFTGGARFVMIKATSTTGNWLVFDTARGMTTSTDPWLALNSAAAESATTGACTTVSSGFAVDESKLTGVNTNGVSYIYLAIA